ncbi:M24 family metallopeptidase [Gloeocapsopsis crepidinum]|uniref:M24 family metallopeptidase n=1 Tax=Gloeocapsopsis crepidinum TaxID=693223 RepID=UPI001D13BDB2|nr:M24 family metallopeptidase [Gloeocapsopsis crepidinum]
MVTAQDAWVLTDEIEAQRLKDEELPANFQLNVNPWADTASREAFVRDATSGGKVLSDRPIPHVEKRLPPALQIHKRVMMSSELARYHQVGRQASEAMTEVLQAAKPTWTEYQLAGAGAEALWARGLHPALTLAAGERRLPLYRHATPSREPLGRQAMLVFCARGFGLYANLTRFVNFGVLADERAMHNHVREIEAEALDLCQPGVTLDAIYHALAHAYQQHGFASCDSQTSPGRNNGISSARNCGESHDN